MKQIIVDTGLKDVLHRLDVFDWIQSSAAVFDTDVQLRYSNAAFDSLQAKLGWKTTPVHENQCLHNIPAIMESATRAIHDENSHTCSHTFYYSRNISVDLTLCFTPIVNQTNGDTIGILLTIGEESVEFDGRHLAKLQQDRRTFIERIKQLSNDKLDNERLIRILLKETPFAIILMNTDRQIVQVNKAAESLFDMPAKHAIGETCDKFLDCHEKCRECPALTQSESVHGDEVQGKTRNGHYLPLLRSAVVLEDSRETLILEALVDVTERKKAERELLRLSDYNELLLNSTGEGIFGVDTGLRCTFANRSAAQMLGYEPSEMVGENIHQLVHSSHPDGAPLLPEDSPILTCIKKCEGTEVEDAVFHTKAGNNIPVRYLCNPLYEDGEITGAVVVYRDVAEARIMARKMDYLARHCPLTGLLNRRVFESRLEELLQLAKQEGSRHVLCYVDLDQFKIVNDTCGHTAGDELLRQLSNIFHNTLGPQDTLARLGGDEFGLLFKDSTLQQAREKLNTLLEEMGNYRFVWDQKPFALSASIGVVPVDKHVANAGEAMVAADTACYAAKEQGRNRIHTYQSDDMELLRRKREMQWATHIRSALEQNRFVLYYQPIVSLHEPDILQNAMEILVRMRDESGNLIMPGAFIPAAERFDLMSSIDRRVVEESLAWLNSNYETLPDFRLCTINLSGQSIGDERFIDFLMERLAEFKPPANILCFEITETSAVSNLTKALNFINRVRQLGCSFALDDFGSGMSSFSYLKTLPVDYLKIDGNFIKDILTDRTDYAMVDAIHKVAGVMGLKTIAEFIENEDVLKALRSIGIDYGQGYGICRPQPLQPAIGKLPPKHA